MMHDSYRRRGVSPIFKLVIFVLVLLVAGYEGCSYFMSASLKKRPAQSGEKTASTLAAERSKDLDEQQGAVQTPVLPQPAAQIPVVKTPEPAMAAPSVPAAQTPQVVFSSAKGLWLQIVKHEHVLYVMNGSDVVTKYDIAVGRNQGQKQHEGDCKTPEGDSFTVQYVQNASGWSHDFHDGKGLIHGAYGPWFIRLRTSPWTGIGIHGTHDPSSIGHDVTEGCIRLHNGDLQQLKEKYIKNGMRVVIVR